MKDIIAIIPARAGSKRIKNKNIKFFFTKPIIYWTISFLKKSNMFKHIIVTSDSPKILKLSKKFGSDLQVLRPKKYSTGSATIDDTIKHAIEYLETKEIKIENIGCFFPCNPFLNIQDLINAFKILKNNNNAFVLSVSKFKHPIQRAYNLLANNKILPKNTIAFNKMTQSFEKTYHDAAQFYIASKKSWLKKNKKKYGIVIPIWRSVDIDDSEDWKNAELLFHAIKCKKK